MNYLDKYLHLFLSQYFSQDKSLKDKDMSWIKLWNSNNHSSQNFRLCCRFFFSEWAKIKNLFWICFFQVAERHEIFQTIFVLKINEASLHFLKHSLIFCRLGAPHDGEIGAEICTTNSGYLMSYNRSDPIKAHRFSICSINKFKEFLK